MRRNHPPEGPEPDWTCPVCEVGVMGERCPECNRDYEAAKQIHREQMEYKLAKFTTMLEEQDAFNFGKDQLRNITYEGNSVKVTPRFPVSVSDILKLPGVKDVALSRESEDHILIDYKHEDEPANDYTEPDLSEFIERVQLLANRHGPSRAARMVHAMLNDDYGRYDTESVENLAVRALAEYWKYER